MYNLEEFMKEHLSNSIKALINGNTEEAKQHFSVYIKQKTKSMLEDMEPGLVEGHCDDCGEEATTSRKSVADKKWTCPKCGGHEFVKVDETKRPV